MTYIDYAIAFSCNFAVVFLLGLQSKNVNNGRYVAAIITSFWLSVSQTVFVKYMSAGGFDIFLAAAIGGCMGIATSIWFYDKYMKKKSTSLLTVQLEVKPSPELSREFMSVREKIARLHGKD